MSYANGT